MSRSAALPPRRSICCGAPWRTASSLQTGPRVLADTELRAAWGRIPSPGTVETEFERFTGKRMERILATVAATGSAILGAQALFAALGGLAQRGSAVHILLLIVVYVPLVGMLVACVLGRGVRWFAGAFAIVYVAALAAWPAVVGFGATTNQPWIFFLVNVGVVAAMLAFPLWAQLVWAIGVPLVYGCVRLVEGEFSRAYWTTT